LLGFGRAHASLVRGNWPLIKKSGEKTMIKELAKSNPEPPKPSPRKVIIALLPLWKNPKETEKKTSPNGAS